LGGCANYFLRGRVVRCTVGRQLGLALVLGLAVTSWTRTGDIDASFSGVVEQTLPDLMALSEVNDRLQFVRTAELAHLAALTMPAKDREEAAVLTAVKGLNDALAREIAKAIHQFNETRVNRCTKTPTRRCKSAGRRTWQRRALFRLHREPTICVPMFPPPRWASTLVAFLPGAVLVGLDTFKAQSA
jgi:hypothetical protein